ncbi:MAG: hypothetical protein J6A28_01340 [Clostridia bacterium]|nr:hypothetical protein [Clostridia bacterium]
MEKEKQTLKTFKNAYCDALYCALGAFMEIREDSYQQLAQQLTREEVEIICQYAAIKNKLAGVGELNLKVPCVKAGVKALDRYGIKGNEILNANYVNSLSAKDLVGGRLMLEVEDLNMYNPAALTDICDFCATTDTPLVIHFGRSLESVGVSVNKFGVSPATLLEEYGFLDRECYLYGMNYIDKDDQILLANYNPMLILSPKSDGEEGKGEINLYNLIYNRLKFCFSSGKCYNIDMFKEAYVALINTNNLMKRADLVDTEILLDALSSGEGRIEIESYACMRPETILQHNVMIADEELLREKAALEEKIINIATKIKGEN